MKIRFVDYDTCNEFMFYLRLDCIPPKGMAFMFEDDFSGILLYYVKEQCYNVDKHELTIYLTTAVV